MHLFHRLGPAALSARHETIYKAAVFADERSWEAWNRWSRDHALVDADDEESPVLPLIAHRIAGLGRTTPQLQRVRGLRRHSWLRQAAIQQELTHASAALREHGIHPIAIKGAALGHVYPATWLRAIGDADLLVRPTDRRRALDVLLATGFSPRLGLRRQDIETWSDRHHALAMARGHRLDIDLHWRLPHQPASKVAATDALWRRRVSVSDDALWSVPHPAHHLAVVVAHGAASTARSGLRMLVDATFLIADPAVTATIIDELAGPHALRDAVRQVVAALAVLGAPRAEELLSELQPVRVGDRLATWALRDDQFTRSQRVAQAIALAAPSLLLPLAAQPMRLGTDGPNDPSGSALLSQAGSGWWIGDAYGTWSRRRIAGLVMTTTGAHDRGTLTIRLQVAHVPGDNHRRWSLVHVHQAWPPRWIRFDPANEADIRFEVGRRFGRSRKIRMVVITPHLVLPARDLGTQDRRALGVVVRSIGWNPAGSTLNAARATSPATIHSLGEMVRSHASSLMSRASRTGRQARERRRGAV